MKRNVPHVAVIGLGGFAQAHHRALLKLEEKGACRLFCASGRNPANYQKFMDEMVFQKRGVQVFNNHLEMLDKHHAELDMVVVPTPIHLHGPNHRDVVERKVPCYLEKPPTLDYRELESMIETDAKAVQPTLVGFNMISDQVRLDIKKRLVRGEFGALRRASFLGYSPRFTPYYTRAGWAGAIEVDGHLVLDSCIGNGLAHYVHNLFLWCGTGDVFSWGELRELDAELYRCHAITNYDTVFARGWTKNGVELRVVGSHSGEMPGNHKEIIECEKATIEWTMAQSWRIEWKNGKVDEQKIDPEGSTIENCLRRYLNFLKGKEPRPLTLLKDCRPYVQLIDLAYVAARKIHTVDPKQVKRTTINPGEESVAIHGIREACDTFIARGELPSQQKLPWAGTGGHAAIEELSRFATIIESVKKNG
jgi:predicted dehydrogenase